MAQIDDNYSGQTRLRNWWQTVKNNFTAINKQLIAHIAGTSDKHNAVDVNYTGDSTLGTDVSGAIGNLKNTNDIQDEKITTLQTNVAGLGNSLINVRDNLEDFQQEVEKNYPKKVDIGNPTAISRTPPTFDTYNWFKSELDIANEYIEPTFIEWDGTIAEEFEGGTGTKDDPYIIATPSQFAYFYNVITSDLYRTAYYYEGAFHWGLGGDYDEKKFNESTDSYTDIIDMVPELMEFRQNQYFKITNYFDFANNDPTQYINGFYSVLDGDNHIFKNLTLNFYAGLINTNYGTIKNLGISPALISFDDVDGQNSGIFTYSNNGIIENCYVVGFISGVGGTEEFPNEYGGIAWDNSGIIRNCYTNMVFAEESYDKAAKGICCYSSGTVENCYSVYYDVPENAINSYGNIHAKTPVEIETIANSLGEQFYKDVQSINDGYPVLVWQLTKTDFITKVVVKNKNGIQEYEIPGADNIEKFYSIGAEIAALQSLIGYANTLLEKRLDGEA